MATAAAALQASKIPFNNPHSSVEILAKIEMHILGIGLLVRFLTEATLKDKSSTEFIKEEFCVDTLEISIFETDL